MTIHLKDCPPALRAKIEAALALEPKQWYAMATFLKGEWDVGPLTTDKVLVEKLVGAFNLSSPIQCYQTRIGKPPAVTVQVEPS